MRWKMSRSRFLNCKRQCLSRENWVCFCYSWFLMWNFSRFFLKFFLKCNQNCLKNAGNPRDMRRFQVGKRERWSLSNTDISRSFYPQQSDWNHHYWLFRKICLFTIIPNMEDVRDDWIRLMEVRVHFPSLFVIRNFMSLESLIPTPVIKHIQPNEGWLVGGQAVLILGENFFDGLQVMFNTMVVYSEVSLSLSREHAHSIRLDDI